MTTVANAPVPSPLTGTFTTLISSAAAHALPLPKESPAVVTLTISNLTILTTTNYVN